MSQIERASLFLSGILVGAIILYAVAYSGLVPGLFPLGAIQEGLQDISREIELVSADLTFLSTALATIEANLQTLADDLSGSIGELDSAVDDLSTTLATLSADVDSLQTGVTKLNTGVEELSAAILSDVSSRLEDLESLVQTISTRIQLMRSELRSVEEEVLGALEAGFSDLQASLTQLGGDIQTIGTVEATAVFTVAQPTRTVNITVIAGDTEIPYVASAITLSTRGVGSGESLTLTDVLIDGYPTATLVPITVASGTDGIVHLMAEWWVQGPVGATQIQLVLQGSTSDALEVDIRVVAEHEARGSLNITT